MNTICKTLVYTVNPPRTVIFVILSLSRSAEEQKYSNLLYSFEWWREGCKESHSLEEPVLLLNEKARFSEGSVSSLYNGSQSRRIKVSIVCLENRELSKSASQCFQTTPSLSVHMKYICLFISVTLFLFPCHCPTLPILLFLWAVSLLHYSLPDSSSAFLPSSLLLSYPNMSLLLSKGPEVPYEVTLPGSVSSPSVSRLAWDHKSGFINCFKIKAATKVPIVVI